MNDRTGYSGHGAYDCTGDQCLTPWTSARAGCWPSGRGWTRSPPTSPTRNTTHDAAGRPNPYRRRFVRLRRRASPNKPGQPGVRVQATCSSIRRPFHKRFEPGHPDADAEGYVTYPNIDLSIEYVNALEASRAYEANVSMMEVTKAMINATLRLIA